MDLFSDELTDSTPSFIKHQLKDGEVWYMPFFIGNNKSKSYLSELSNAINWKQENIKMFGKTHPVPRTIAWHADSGLNYKYAGVNHFPEPWTPVLLEIKTKIEELLGETFNSVLLNNYADGLDKMGWHADNEKELGLNPVIASVSFGATRRFDLKNNKIPDEKLQIELTSGSLLVMRGALQHHWKHQLPQQKKVIEQRINLTFRKIYSGVR